MKNKWVILTLTHSGVKKALEVKEVLDERAEIYTLSKYAVEGVNSFEEGFKAFLNKHFDDYDYFLFIMATGIVVRSITGLLKHKSIDPAVLVMDEKGNNVISLISGHLGGANQATLSLASKLNANPVITTSSDVSQKIAVDTLAMQLDYYISDFERAKDITALIVNDEDVAIVTDKELDLVLPDNVIVVDYNRDLTLFKGVIELGDKLTDESLNVIHLKPKDIIIGIGSRKGKPLKEIKAAINDACLKLGIDLNRLLRFATVDVKQEEQGIIDAANHFKVDLSIIRRKEIKKVEHLFKGSEFVKKTIGVSCVSEPCGYIESNQGEMLLEKSAYDGITLSIWKVRST